MEIQQLLLIDVTCEREMVEGHQVHRVAQLHRRLLRGKSFKATSPNGRFVDGARALDRRELHRVDAVGKNLFYFFGKEHDAHEDTTVMHVHFGMSGRFSVFSRGDDVPEVTPTTRLRLENQHAGLTAMLSAMTVQHGGMDMYERLRSKLGQDPLRADADFELLWQECGQQGARYGHKSIGEVLMDQARIAGVGNIYRAEICFKARVHPEQPCASLGRAKFEEVWRISVELLRRGFLVGSILTVDEADELRAPGRRRYIYNQETCMMCGSRVVSWDMKTRTVYACPTCQPLKDVEASDDAAETATTKKKVRLRKAKKKKEEEEEKLMQPSTSMSLDPKRQKALDAAKPAALFVSHCARDVGEHLPVAKMKVADLKAALGAYGLSTRGKKAELGERLDEARAAAEREVRGEIPIPMDTDELEAKRGKMATAQEAAAEKESAGEKRNVEHVALNVMASTFDDNVHHHGDTDEKTKGKMSKRKASSSRSASLNSLRRRKKA